MNPSPDWLSAIYDNPTAAAQLAAVKREQAANPGVVVIERVNALEAVYRWEGGRIAAMCAELWEWMEAQDAAGALPWGVLCLATERGLYGPRHYVMRMESEQ